MTNLPVFILDKDAAIGDWVRNQLIQIGVEARWVASVSELLSEAESQPPCVCLVALRAPVGQALTLITGLTQEPRFSSTAFILIGPMHYKHAAFEAGADDYLITPPDVIELRKRVRLYLDRAVLEARLVAETRITQEMETFSKLRQASDEALDEESLTLLQHAAALTQERNLFDTILRCAREAISFVGPDGTLRYVNPAWEALIGQKRPVRVGDVIEWPPVSTDTTVTEAVAHAIDARHAWQGEIRYALPDQSVQELAVTIQPVFDVAGELTGSVVTQSDAVEDKAVEAVRTRFLSDAAAGMRTPVTNLKMRYHLLREALPDQREMHLDALAREIERLSEMVDAMLELARLDAGLTLVTAEQVNLTRLIDETVTRYHAAAQDKGVTLAGKGDEAIAPVSADSVLLARAVGILIDNAIRYTPEAGHIEVRLGRENRSDGAFVTIRVQDTGMGIEPEAIPFVFDRFYRSDRARDSATRGVGLGLAIAREIVSRQNGQITAESQVNQGSTFTIRLPAGT
jgi:signal transduction histidine kinase/DNA-binding response OmpR family regulator